MDITTDSCETGSYPVTVDVSTMINVIVQNAHICLFCRDIII